MPSCRRRTPRAGCESQDALSVDPRSRLVRSHGHTSFDLLARSPHCVPRKLPGHSQRRCVRRSDRHFGGLNPSRLREIPESSRGSNACAWPLAFARPPTGRGRRFSSRCASTRAIRGPELLLRIFFCHQQAQDLRQIRAPSDLTTRQSAATLSVCIEVRPRPILVSRDTRRLNATSHKYRGTRAKQGLCEIVKAVRRARIMRVLRAANRPSLAWEQNG